MGVLKAVVPTESGSFKSCGAFRSPTFFEEIIMYNKKLRLYTIDMKYIRDLSKADDKVMSCSPQTGKDSRPFVGVIVVCDSKKYCIPLTSPKAKHQKMKNDLDFSKIIDKNGSTIGALNFNNMIPVDKSIVNPIDIRPKKTDSHKDKVYKELLNNQLDWCNENIDNITKKANKLYIFVTVTPEKSRNLTRRCCDFKKLEKILEKWLDKSQNVDKDTQERSAKRPPTVSKPSKDSYKRLRESFNASRKKNEAEKPMPKRNKGKDDHDL